MKAEIDIDWLDAEIENTETKIKVFKEGHVLRHIQEAICGKLHEVRSKCTPIEAPKEQELPNYCVVKNKEYCFLSGKCKECSIIIEEPFLSKTCINNWESAKYCQNENKCQMCVTKNKQMKNSIEYLKKEIEYHKSKVKEFEEYLGELNYEMENDDFIITKDDIYKTIEDAKKNVVTRLYSGLSKRYCLNTKDLCQLDEGQVRKFRDFGNESINLLKKYLTEKGKSLSLR